MTISPEEARKLLSQDSAPTITPEEAKRLLAQDVPQKQSFIDPNNPSHSNPGTGLALYSNLAQGLGKAGSSVLKSAIGIGDWLNNTNAASIVPENFAPEMSPEAKQASINHPNYATLGYGVGYAAPAFTPLGIESKVAGLTKGASAAMKFLAKMGARGAEGGIIGAAYNPESRTLGGAEGGAIGAATVPVGALAKSLFNIPKIMTKGSTATSEEAKRNFEASRAIGAKMQLGQVIQNPTLSSLQSSMSYIPGSGQAQSNMNVGKAIKNTVGSIVDLIKPESTEALNNSLQESLKTTAKVAENQKKLNYADIEKHADSIKAKVTLNNVIRDSGSAYKTLTKYMKETDEFSDVYSASLLGKLKELSKRKPIEKTQVKNLNLESGLAKSIDEFISKKEGKLIKKSKTDKISFGAALALDRDINASIAKADAKNDVITSSFLHSIKDSLNTDIEVSALDTRNHALIQKWNDAKEHFSNEVIPLRSPAIAKFIRGDANNEKIIPTFLKGGQFEQPQQLDKLTRYLTSKQKQGIAHEYLTHGMREVKGQRDIKEAKVLQNYEKMGDEVKKMLLTDAQRAALDNALITKKNMNLDLNQMVNPKTGASLTKAAAMAGTAATGFMASIAANAARRGLQNDWFIKQYIKQIEKLEGRRNSPITKVLQKGSEKLPQKLSPALIAFLSNNR